jgi:hypothetical protein
MFGRTVGGGLGSEVLVGSGIWVSFAGNEGGFRGVQDAIATLIATIKRKVNLLLFSHLTPAEL